MKKPRSDSKLAGLPAEAKAAIEQMLVHENLPYSEVKKELLDQHGIETSVGALSHYYRRHLILLRIEEAKRACDELGKAAEGGDLFVERGLYNIQQAFFEMTTSGEMSVRDIKDLASVIGQNTAAKIKLKELSLAERKVELLEKKAVAFDRAAGVMESQLSEEEKAAALRQLFGMAG